MMMKSICGVDCTKCEFNTTRAVLKQTASLLGQSVWLPYTAKINHAMVKIGFESELVRERERPLESKKLPYEGAKKC